MREALPAFEEDEAGDAEDHDAEIEGGETCGLGIGDELPEDGLREEPEDGDGDAEDEEEAGHALELEANERPVTGAVGLGAECVEGRGEALEGGEAGDGRGHVGHCIKGSAGEKNKRLKWVMLMGRGGAGRGEREGRGEGESLT